MAKSADMTNAESESRKRRGISPAESAVAIAAALEMLILVGGLLWAISGPPGVSLWGRILLVTVLAVLAAVIAVFACAPAFRSAAESAQEPSDPAD